MMISEKNLKGRTVNFSKFYLKIYRLTFFIFYNESTNAQLIDDVLHCSLFIVQNNERGRVQVLKYRLTFTIF